MRDSFSDILQGVDLPSDAEVIEETRRAKISISQTGRSLSENTRQKQSQAKKGIPLTDAQKKAHRENSLKRKGVSLSAEHREKISQAGQGRKHSEETRSKMSVAKKGKLLGPDSIETRIKKSKAQKKAYANGKNPPMLGKNHSKEAREKISAANKGRTLSKEIREKISQSKKGKSYGGNFKPVRTPYGVFESLSIAGKYEESITGKKFNPNRYTKLIKTENSGYERISIEEYNEQRTST